MAKTAAGWTKQAVLNRLYDAGIYPDEERITKHRDGSFSFRKYGFYFTEAEQIEMMNSVKAAFGGWSGYDANGYITRVGSEVKGATRATQGMACLVTYVYLADSLVPAQPTE